MHGGDSQEKESGDRVRVQKMAMHFLEVFLECRD